MPTTALIIIHPRELLRLGLQSVLKGQAGFKDRPAKKPKSLSSSTSRI